MRRNQLFLQMSEERLKAFREDIKADAAFQEKLRVADDADAVAAIAKEAGDMISSAKLKVSRMEFSDKVLENVTGGEEPGLDLSVYHPFQSEECAFTDRLELPCVDSDPCR